MLSEEPATHEQERDDCAGDDRNQDVSLCSQYGNRYERPEACIQGRGEPDREFHRSQIGEQGFPTIAERLCVRFDIGLLALVDDDLAAGAAHLINDDPADARGDFSPVGSRGA